MNLEDITIEILKEMVDTGSWDIEVINRRRCNKLNPNPETHWVLRNMDYPNAWDINCGWCEEWARMAVKKYGGKAVWMDEINPNFGEEGLDICHCILIKDGRYYDSQHSEVVDSPWDMDIVNGVTRGQFL